MADKHEHGSMNIEVQEATFSSFIQWMMRGAMVVIFLLIILYVVGG